ncbi:MAG: carbonic anhydrase [Gemmatimonas sp.]
MAAIDKLTAGFRVFRAKYFDQRPEIYEDLVKVGQSPGVMVIACSDSRVDPAILLNAEPGELFVVRNVANLVPPYQPDGHYHGTSAALEFAVRDLGVRDVVVLGHSRCGGMEALRRSLTGNPVAREFIGPWVSIVEPHTCSHEAADAELSRRLEEAAIRTSLTNLRTFPWVAEAERTGKLALHGWWFDLEAGALFGVQPDGEFAQMS